MFKKSFLAILLAGISLSSSAGVIGGIGYMNLSDDDDNVDITLGAVVGSLGYKMVAGPGLYIIPEARFGFGVVDDTVNVLGVDVDIELDRFTALSLRGQYESASGLYLFVAPSYAQVKASATIAGQTLSISDDDWELGAGGGLGYYFNPATALEFSFEQYDGTDVATLGLKFDL